MGSQTGARRDMRRYEQGRRKRQGTAHAGAPPRPPPLSSMLLQTPAPAQADTVVYKRRRQCYIQIQLVRSGEFDILSSFLTVLTSRLFHIVESFNICQIGLPLHHVSGRVPCAILGDDRLKWCVRGVVRLGPSIGRPSIHPSIHLAAVTLNCRRTSCRRSYATPMNPPGPHSSEAVHRYRNPGRPRSPHQLTREDPEGPAAAEACRPAASSSFFACLPAGEINARLAHRSPRQIRGSRRGGWKNRNRKK